MDLGLLLRAVVSLAVVVTVITVLARGVRRHRPVRSGSLVHVTGRVALHRSASVTTVRFHDEELLLGVTDTSISVLSSRPWSELDDRGADEVTDMSRPRRSGSDAVDPLETDIRSALTPATRLEKWRSMTSRIGPRP